ncbi:efflux RND transporter periplasmic adaptor subunit [Flavihumibacter petaseus]|uniref:Putative RND-type efflux pump membrane fusion protein n=1 Tax=Flavihumibacter petaseus NBRC 106054 TaxID=1220578 RepID=A0A0E9N3C2_9BACT|nr:efflux RND transporter periplasmic adaptor subunit [Flavihumibacter petaseus]GAO44457.1 putative RND-type efflux pump membrane fusion protein [Flavihumibacter petaseus NBRC 106054]
MPVIVKQYFIACLALCTFVTACHSNKDKKIAPPAAGGPAGPAKPTRVEGHLVKTSTVSEKLEVPGSLLPYEATELRPEVSGRITQLNIREGQSVGKGALLVKLYDADLQAQLKKLQVQLEMNEKTAQRQGELLKIDGISKQEYDLSVLQVSNVKADIELIRTSIEKTEIRAPFNGRIGLRNVSIGAYVTPATLITNIRQEEQLKLEFTVPEKYSSKVSTGKKIQFTVEGLNKSVPANVIATEEAVTEDSRSLRVRAVVEGKAPQLIPGAFAKVLLDFGQDNNALMIPSQAVIPQARSKKVIVYRGGTAKFETVTTGVRDSSQVQILSGLMPGDTIVITGLLTIKPEGKIEISKMN